MVKRAISEWASETIDSTPLWDLVKCSRPGVRRAPAYTQFYFKIAAKAAVRVDDELVTPVPPGNKYLICSCLPSTAQQRVILSYCNLQSFKSGRQPQFRNDLLSPSTSLCVKWKNLSRCQYRAFVAQEWARVLTPRSQGQPVVSIANVAQLAVDLLIASLSLRKIGIFDPRDLVPVIGGREDGGEGITTPLECVY